MTATPDPKLEGLDEGELDSWLRHVARNGPVFVCGCSLCVTMRSRILALRSEVDRLKEDAERWQEMRTRLVGLDFAYGEPPILAAVFRLADGHSYGADPDKIADTCRASRSSTDTPEKESLTPTQAVAWALNPNRRPDTGAER